MRSRRIRVGILLGFLLLFLVIAAAPEWPAFGDHSYQLDTLIESGQRFDFVRWEFAAFQTKFKGTRNNNPDQLTESLRHEQVGEFLGDIDRTRQLQAHIDRIYADAAIAELPQAAAEFQSELDSLRRDMVQRQPQVEAIVQRQVAAVLADEGLTWGGDTFPPVLMHMTRLPNMLIVSPRDRIEQIDYATLVADFTTEEKDSLENAVFDELDLSGLVVGLGGLGTYPSMIQETTSIGRLADVTAHEWAHHWLALRPLGRRYLASPEMRTINETTASIIGAEVGVAVVEQFYEELTVPLPQVIKPAPTAETPPFDYATEMAETRIYVDELLAEGRIEEAEAYMEQRRQVFVTNGYMIRKLNQAYFAMYGGYAREPGGAAGSDPVGPMLRDIRDHSSSLKVFMDHVGGVTSIEELMALYRVVVGRDPDIVVN